MKIENIADLRVLLATARHGSLSAAARELEITPAASSAMLKRLEAQLGARLFVRSTRALRLTAEGEMLLSYAQRALELLEEGVSQVGAGTASLSGAIRVAAPPDLARGHLLKLFDAFILQHPAVAISVSISDKLQDLHRDALDLALRYGNPADSQLVARKLLQTRRIACATPGYFERHGKPSHPQELSKHNCISLHIAGKRETRWYFERLDAGKVIEHCEVRIDGSRMVNDGALAHDWALLGQGIVYKSALDVHDDLQSGRLVAAFSEWQGQSYTLNAIYPGNRFLPARVRALIDHLQQGFAKDGQSVFSPVELV